MILTEFVGMKAEQNKPKSGLPYSRRVRPTTAEAINELDHRTEHAAWYSRDDKLLAAIQKHARSVRGCKAISVLQAGSLFGNSEYELIEMEDTSHWAWTHWDLRSREVPVGGKATIDIDLVNALWLLRRQNPRLRCIDDQPATDRGRYQTLYIATATDGEWLIRRSLGAGEPLENVWETVAAAILQGAIAARKQATNRKTT
jgi:hypothetical protein